MKKQEQSINQVFLAAQNWLIFFILFAGAVYLTSIIMTSFSPLQENVKSFNTEMKAISSGVLGILKPFVELVIIFWLTDWILRKMGFGISKGFSQIHWNTRTIIYISLLFTFIVATLVLTEALYYLKGVILLMAGLLIGSKVELPSVQYFINVHRGKETEDPEIE
nr:hypothetical protein [uncultured Allomuricauda sp.]